MHGRIATVRVRPGTANQVTAGWRHMLSPYEVAGAFRGLISLHQPDDNVGVTPTFWESAEVADAVVGSLRDQSMEAFEDVLLEPPVINSYDVLLTPLAQAGDWS